MSATPANKTGGKDAPKPATETNKEQQKPAATLEEDDEFEDFPLEDWDAEGAEVSGSGNAHLWEESWDDDDSSEEFSAQLKEELKKVEANKRA
ncbi:MAG: 26S proteasome complex subunit [Geoglossum umbratile]|nr:MAG: 26S proteasome complex subunit [Geoglossum umbratile]